MRLPRMAERAFGSAASLLKWRRLDTLWRIDQITEGGVERNGLGLEESSADLTQ
jgi:hypothetical protein